jgi:hypothetical protein
MKDYDTVQVKLLLCENVEGEVEIQLHTFLKPALDVAE